MKKQISIPRRKYFVPVPKKIERPVLKEEKVRLKDIQLKDMEYMALRINLTFLLADIQESLIMEAEHKLQETNAEYSLDMKNSIQRIKVHTRNLVSFFDNTASEKFALGFGEKSDEIKGQLLEMFSK